MNQEQKPIFSFGEKEKDMWYAHEDGVRIPCGEAKIDSLWRKWVIATGAKRHIDKDGYCVYELENNQPF